MSYDAITIDTQTVYANGRHLDRGLVGQLEQYKDGIVQVVLSEIVVRELRAMLIEKAKATTDALTKAMTEGDKNGQFSADQKASLQKLMDEIATPEEHAKEQLKNFVKATGAHIVSSEKASGKDILQAYFDIKPPFASKGKKAEFPDAFSLFALEAWAKEKQKKILVVSDDPDWKAFAAASPDMTCMPNLADAMSALVQAVGTAEIEAKKVLDAIIKSNPPNIAEDFRRQLSRAVESETPYVEFESSTPGEDEGVSLGMDDYEFGDLEEGYPPITIIRVGADGFVMKVPVIVTANASAEIGFSVYDSVDKDYVPMGSTTVERSVELEASALIHCKRLESDQDTFPYEITDVEVVGLDSVDLGYVDFSLADSDEPFDPDDFEPPSDEESEEEGVQGDPF